MKGETKTSKAIPENKASKKLADGEVPPGHELYVSGGRSDGSTGRSFESLLLCSTDKDNLFLGECGDGGTYSKTVEVPKGEPVSYDYHDGSYTGKGLSDKIFFTGERTFVEDATVRATYRAGNGGNTVDPTTPGTTTPGNGGSGGEFLSGAVGGVRSLLPETGGLPLAVLLAGAVLIPGGLFVRKLTR